MKYSSFLLDLRNCKNACLGVTSTFFENVVAMGKAFPGARVIKIPHRSELSNIN